MKQPTDFLYLSEADMLRAGVCDMSGCIDTMADVFSLMARDDYRMGGPSANEHGIKMLFPQTSSVPGMPLDGPDRRFVAMPAYLGGKYRICGIKCYGSNQKNRTKGLPRSILMLTLMDVETGLPIAYLSANVLSAMRTGAVPGLGVRYLATAQPTTAAIIGPGVMGRTAIDAILTERPTIDTIKVRGRGPGSLDAFLSHCREKHPSVKNYVVCEDVESVCRDADILCVGTNNAPRFDDNPKILGSWLKPGALVMSTSALIMEHDFLADDRRCRLVADHYRMYEGWGEGHAYPTQKSVTTLIGMCFYDLVVSGKISQRAITDIGELINNGEGAVPDASRVTVYAVGGMPTEDVAWGLKCYRNAVKQGIGKPLCLWDSPAMV